MSTNVGKIRLRNLAELQQTQLEKDEVDDVIVIAISSADENKTPEKPKKAGSKRASSTAKKKSNDETKKIVTNTAVKRTVKKEPLPGQMRIDSFFKSSAKSYKVEIPSENSPIKIKARKGRKRLFDEESTTKESIPKTSVLCSDSENKRKPERKRTLPQRKAKAKCSTSPAAIIDLCSDNESESNQNINAKPIPIVILKDCQLNPLPMVNIPNLEIQESNDAGTRSKENEPKERKRKRCPSYKIVEDTTFVVDGFQFGDIPNATHYFLSHYHADHYVGLTRKFAHPLYMSPITAKLVRTFIPIDKQYMHEIDVGESIVINEVEITAIEANQ